jgi:hypothetical protein
MPTVHPDLPPFIAVCRARNYVAQWGCGLSGGPWYGGLLR